MERQSCHTEDEEGPIPVLVADGEALKADRTSLRAFSSVFRSIPFSAECWDLRNLIIGEQPVQRIVVKRWLECVETAVNGSAADPYPVAGAAGGVANDPLNTATALVDLLTFADAVGSSRGVMNLAGQRLEHVCIHANLEEQQVGLIISSEAGYTIEHLDAGLPIWQSGVFMYTLEKRHQVAGTYQSYLAETEFGIAVAQQVEALLYWGYKLQLQHLINTVQGFIFRSYCLPFGVLRYVMRNIFTDRVLELALGRGYSEEQKLAWVTRVLTKPCGFVPGGQDRQMLQDLLKPASAPSFDPATGDIHFDAVLKRDLFGSSSGSQVPVTLSLFKDSSVQIGSQKLKLPAQVLLGCGAFDHATFQEVTASYPWNDPAWWGEDGEGF